MCIYIDINTRTCAIAEYDWEASHFSKVTADVSHDQSLPLDHDDVIIKAMPVQQHEQEQVHVCT